VKKVDAVGNVTCFAYDLVHRLTATTYPSGSYASVTPAKHFVYEAATVNGVAMSGTAGRLAEAYTCTGACSSKLTDLGFSYSARGEVTDVYESTPNSGGYYHASATYWANGLLDLLNLKNGGGTVSFIPQITYSPDGEGRVSYVTAASGQNPIPSGTPVSYNTFGEPTAVAFGSLDSDAFSYDPNMGRLTQYGFTVNGSSVAGNVTWNTNGTLEKLAVTDPFNASNTQTCGYSYDDLARVSNVNCLNSQSQPIWTQAFTFDAFGNAQNPPGPVTPIYDPTAPCGRDPYGEPLPCGWGFPWWLLPEGGTIAVLVLAQAPQPPQVQPRSPGCFGVFLSATAKAWLLPSVNPSTGLTAASYAAVPVWSWAAGKSVGIRAGFNFFRVPAQAAAQAARYAQIASFLEEAVPYLQVASFAFAGWQGLQAEWGAAQTGACGGVF